MLENVLKERIYKRLLKESPKCWDCSCISSNRWYKNYTQCSSCSFKEWRIKNLEKRKLYKREYRISNKQILLEKKRIYNQKTKNNTHIQCKRRAKKKQAMPSWINLDLLQQIYQNCPKNMVIDHIIPLQNELVSGLHVPWNLQYLDRSSNAYKHNKFDLSYENDSWRKECQ